MIQEETIICLKDNALLTKCFAKIKHIIDLLLNLCKTHWAFDNRGQEWLRFLDFIQKWLEYGGKTVENGKEIEEFKKNIFSSVFSEFATNVSLTILTDVIFVFFG